MTNELKSQKNPLGNSIYHLATVPVRVILKIHKRIESSINEFDEHQIWKVITWLLGSSLGLPSKFGISEDNLEGITSKKGECKMGAFINRDKSSKSKVGKNGNFRLTSRYW